MLKIALEYNNPDNNKRPSTIYYRFKLLQDEVLQHQIIGFVENEQHTNARLESCWSGNIKYNFVKERPDNYFVVKSCRADPEASTQYGPKVLLPSR